MLIAVRAVLWDLIEPLNAPLGIPEMSFVAPGSGGGLTSKDLYESCKAIQPE